MNTAKVVHIGKAKMPQTEDGYTRVANELLDAILRSKFTSRELNVLMAIIRKTYGYNKKEDDMSASQIGALTGIGREHVTRTLNALETKRVINKRPGVYGCIVGIQKDYSEWVIAKEVATVASANLAHPVPIQTVASANLAQSSSAKLAHTKDNYTKDNQKTSSCAPQAESVPGVPLPASRKKDTAAIESRFATFYEAYPRKRSKKAALKIFTRINPSDELLAEILAGIARALKSGEWTDAQFIPHPSSWLNAEGWSDEIQAEYSESEIAVIDSFNEALGGTIGEVKQMPFVGSRAAAIRDFATFSDKPGFQTRYFPWVALNADLPPHVGFDWLISRNGFSNVTNGQHDKRDPK